MPSEVKPCRERFCWNCGESLGHYTNAEYDPLDTCGSIECQREARDADEAARADRRWNAEADDYARY